jgi:hypothetical protein
VQEVEAITSLRFLVVKSFTSTRRAQVRPSA